jgi:NADPH-dependent curcumin reductase CurA
MPVGTKYGHVSLDPAMRGWMNAGASYIDPVEIGDVMRAGAVGRVIASEHPGFAVGEHVYSDFGVQEYALSDGKGVIKVDPLARRCRRTSARWA